MCLSSIEHADKMKYDVKKERENIVTNVEIARYDQFFQTMFSKVLSCKSVKFCYHEGKD